MLPVLLRVPEWFPILAGEAITSFGVMMLAAMLVGGWLLARRMDAAGLPRERAWDLVIAVGFGGVLGAKLYYLLLHWPDFMMDPVSALSARGGLVWYGGFMFGSLAGIWRAWSLRLPVPTVADAAAPVLALAYAIGRVGCFLVGDDYGLPTAGPLGVAFPRGAPPSTPENLQSLFGVPVPPELAGLPFVPVHPTQLYEAALSFAIFAGLLLWERNRGRMSLPGTLFGIWLVCAGLERFAVEFLRAKDDRFLGLFTIAQVISLAVAALGLVVLMRSPQPAPARVETA